MKNDIDLRSNDVVPTAQMKNPRSEERGFLSFMSEKELGEKPDFLYFLNIFKSNVQIKPNVPKIIINMGTNLSSFTSSLNSNKYQKPKSNTNTEIIKLIMKNNFGCFFSNSSKYGFVLKAISSPPCVYYSIKAGKNQCGAL